MQWVVTIPLKAPAAANTRLAPVARSAGQLIALTRAMRADTIDAVQAVDGVQALVFVVDEGSTASGEHVVVQRTPGLNAALAEAAQYAVSHWPDAGVATLVGDLPALRPDELDAALTAAAGYPSAFVPDHLGTGTTLLTAGPGQELAPRFGPGSATAHALVATALTAGPGLRTDVDTADDLARAAELGVGPRTARELPHLLLTRKEHDLGHENRSKRSLPLRGPS